MQTIQITAVIITLNEQKNILRCLDSIDFCNEIIIVDSGSNDETIALAEKQGARVIYQEWLGYGPQKQFAVNQSKNDWVLCLDADEVVSSQLAQAIKTIQFDSLTTVAFKMPRRNHFMGRALAHGEGYPDKSLRLFHRKYGSWSNDVVHEGVEVKGNVGTLSGDLLHFSQDSITDYLRKQNLYTQLQAQILFKSNKRVGYYKCLTSPIARFIKFYIIKLGFLDGFPGFVHIVIGCTNAFFKYAKLVELQKSARRDKL